MSHSSSGSQLNRPKNRQAPWVLVVLFVLVAVGAWFGLRALQKTKVVGAEDGGGAGLEMPPSMVSVLPVRSVPSQHTHRVLGTLHAAHRAEVAAREDGAVMEVLVDEGDTVEEGQILARLDQRRMDAHLAQAQATLTAAESLIAQREAEQARSVRDFAVKRSLHQKGAISESEFLDAERQAKVSKSQAKSANDSYAAAKAALDLLEVRFEDLVIRAPFDARIVSREIEVGEWMRPGEAAFTLVSSGTIEARLQVPERFVASLGDSKVTVQIGSESFEASSLRLVPEADPLSRVVTVIADLQDDGGKLVPGLSVAAEVPVSDNSPKLAVPTDAVVTTYAGPAIYRSSPQDGGQLIAERLPVTVLFQRDGMAYIASDGLKENDLIVVEGNERLFPHAPILHQPSKAAGHETASVGVDEH